MPIISKEKAKFIRKEFLQDIGALGSFPVHFLIITTLLLIPSTYYIGMMNLLGFVLTIIIAYIIRILYFKERPNKRTHDTLLERIDASSFPSIHTARSFCFVVITGYALKPIALIFLILIAIIIAYSRVTLKYHHKFDVIAGAILGIVLAIGILFLF